MRLKLKSLTSDRRACAIENTYDSRFRALLPRADWEQLEPAIQRRFSKRLKGVEVALYRGEIVTTRMNMAGWLLTQICRLIGAPLPLHSDHNVPAIVVVSEDEITGGQRWTRIYHRHHGNPQVINSAKVFGGTTGIEEHVGGGVGMALRVEAKPDRLRFVSDHYFLRFGTLRLRFPVWLAPGQTVVTHRDLGDGFFAFDLDLCHPLMGEMVHQHAVFRDG